MMQNIEKYDLFLSVYFHSRTDYEEFTSSLLSQKDSKHSLKIVPNIDSIMEIFQVIFGNILG